MNEVEIMDLFANHYDLLTESERKLLHYILNHQKEVISMTAQKVADQCHVSKTVLINMAQKIGFEGFNDLRFYLKQEDSPIPISSLEQIETTLVGNVQRTLQINRKDKMEEIADLILQSSCVYVISRGTSKAIGSYLGHLLLTLNIKCIVIPDYNLLSIIARQMTSAEMLIAMSLSGKTNIIVETAKLVQSRGNKLVSISAFANNELNLCSDYHVYCASDIIDTKVDDTVTRIGMFTAVDLLVHYVKTRRK